MIFSELPVGRDFIFSHCEYGTYTYHKINSDQALLNSPYAWHIADIKPECEVVEAEYKPPKSCPIWEKKFLSHVEQLDDEYGTDLLLNFEP